MDGFIIQQGQFTSNGNPVILALPSTVDFIQVENLSVIGTNPNPSQGYEFRWQSNMTIPGDAIEVFNTAGATTLNERILSNVPLSSGFTAINQGTDPLLASPVATTAISNATQPAFTVASTASFGPTGATATITVAQALGAIEVGGILGTPIDVTVTNGTTLTTIPVMQQAQGAAGTAGTIRQLNRGSSFFPATQFLFNIATTGGVATVTAPVVTTSVAHGYSAGQKIIFFIPDKIFGMTQANGVVATITATAETQPANFTAYTFQCDMNTTGFTAFNFPTAAQSAAVGNAFTRAQCAPYGENTAFAIGNGLNVLADASTNVLLVGIKLGAGIHGPAGVNGNKIQWRAWKAYNTFNNGQNVNGNPNP